MKLSYGKFKNKDGTYEEDKTFPIRVFDGGKLKACFTCKKYKECNAQTLDECQFEKKDQATLFSGLFEKKEK